MCFDVAIPIILIMCEETEMGMKFGLSWQGEVILPRVSLYKHCELEKLNRKKRKDKLITIFYISTKLLKIKTGEEPC